MSFHWPQYIKYLLIAMAAISMAASCGAYAKDASMELSPQVGLGYATIRENADYAYGYQDENESGGTIYPELGLQLRSSLLSLGGRIGYLWDDNNTEGFLPIQIELGIYPLEMLREDPVFQPFLSFLVGGFLAIGPYNEVSAFAITGRLGLELQMKPFLLYGDIRYAHASVYDENVSGMQIVFGSGVLF
jgi:hypothetical protein